MDDFVSEHVELGNFVELDYVEMLLVAGELYVLDVLY